MCFIERLIDLYVNLHHYFRQLALWEGVFRYPAN